MSRYEWLVSLFVVWHLTSFSLSALASPDDIDRYRGEYAPNPYWIARQIRPLAETAARGLESMSRSLWWVTTPARVFTAPYGEAVALPQRWIMFARPGKYLSYVRIRYFWNSDDDDSPGVFSADELVFPRDREDEVRLVASYWNSFHSKAMSSALTGFFADRDEGLDEYSSYLTPLLTHFAARFESRYLRPSQEVFRTEMWHGVTPIPPPGERVSDENAGAHFNAVSSYYGGIVPRPVSGRSYQARESIERQAGITWTLLDLRESP